MRWDENRSMKGVEVAREHALAHRRRSTGTFHSARRERRTPFLEGGRLPVGEGRPIGRGRRVWRRGGRRLLRRHRRLNKRMSLDIRIHRGENLTLAAKVPPSERRRSRPAPLSAAGLVGGGG